MNSFRVTIVGFMLLLVGCQATSLIRKEANLRDQVNDLYIDQAMDNLVRARTHRPFVLMDYRDFQFQGTDAYGGGGGFGYQSASIIQRVFNIDVAGERKEYLAFKSNPITDRNDVYKNYIAFASTQGLLNVSDEKPDHSYLCRYYCGQYYWIPEESAPVFMSLVMDGNMLLGEETAPVAAYERIILGVETLGVLPLEGDSDQEDHQVVAMITLDAEVPASDGTMVVKLRDGRTVRFRYTKMAINSPKDGELVKQFQATWNRKQSGFDIHDLKGLPVRIYSDLFPPEASSVDSFQQEVIDGLQDIRALQFMDGRSSF
ncbi:hypothetical protein [Gimesia sp.]|uniref:hypothetical protein n=1 Tax=Gimesia sp. TaxID=2024833 RepID=UPI003A8F1ED0